MRLAPGKIVSLTVERSDGLWTASTGFTTSGGTLDEVLPVTNTPAEFVVKATLNTGTSTETLEVDVDVVKPWTDVGTWTPATAALVQANADGASLWDLALAITGDVNDASALGNVRTIRQGTMVDVTPLLNILEATLRGNVVAAAAAPKSVGFGTAGNAASLAYNALQIAAVFVAAPPRRRLTAWSWWSSKWRTP